MPKARQDEIEWLPGQYYHIYNRGARGVTIFRQERNYAFVIKKLNHYLAVLNLTIIAYCFMPNHYHFLVRQDGEFPAGLLAQRIFNSYSKAYNHAYNHIGTLFVGRFQAKRVTNDEWLRHLCRYIHGNPVKDGIALAPNLWLYSNYLDWIQERDGELIDEEFIDAHFASRQAYKEFTLDWLSGRGNMPPDLADYLKEL